MGGATKTVMVVDDSSAIRKQVGRMLRDAGFEVVEAVDGRDAVEKLEVDPLVSVIICDLNMPRMDGLEFLASSADKWPVLMLTTEGQADLLRQAKALGAKGWIMKPFKGPLLIAAVHKLAAGSHTHD